MANNTTIGLGIGLGMSYLGAAVSSLSHMIDALLTEQPLTVMGDMTDVEIYDAFVIFNGEEV